MAGAIQSLRRYRRNSSAVGALRGHEVWSHRRECPQFIEQAASRRANLKGRRGQPRCEVLREWVQKSRGNPKRGVIIATVTVGE